MLTQVQHQFGRLFVFPVFSLVWIFLSQVLDSADAARQFTLATMFVFVLFTSFSTSFYSILWNNFHEVQIAFEFNLIDENCKSGEKELGGNIGSVSGQTHTSRTVSRPRLFCITLNTTGVNA